MPLVIAIVAGLFIAVWAGVRIAALVTEYPAQIAVAGISFVVLTVAATTVHIRHVLNNRVRIVPEQPRAIASGSSRAVIAPYINAPVTPGTCEGPGCGRPHGADPYVVGVTRPGCAEEEHYFCSRPCCDNWKTGRS